MFTDRSPSLTPISIRTAQGVRPLQSVVVRVKGDLKG
jgi:hypothetical protein